MSNGIRIPPKDPLATMVEDDDGLTFPVPPLHTWLEEPGASPAGKGMVEQWARAFGDNYQNMKRLRASFEGSEGIAAHAAGTYLRELRGHQAWKALDLAGFQELCRDRLGVPERSATRLMFFAKVTTRETAGFGIRKCIAGFALATALGAGGLEALLPKGAHWKEPAAWAQRLGEPVDFVNSPAARLERLAGLLAKPKLPDAPSEEVRDVVEKRQLVFERVARRFPVLEDMGLRSFARDGEARVGHEWGTNREEFAALAALYAALAKSG